MADDEARLVASIVEILRRGPMRTPTLREIEECDAVFILGEDVTSVAPENGAVRSPGDTPAAHGDCQGA
jgi:NADH-quinone oxidoreductase subunit G